MGGYGKRMNIFYLDNDIVKAAQYHTDKHIVKMPLETVQIICTSIYLVTEKVVAYKPTHVHHPCNLWAAESLSNLVWLVAFGNELGKEYTYRYERQHKSHNVLMTKVYPWLVKHKELFKDKGITKRPLAMPDLYKSESVIQSYRDYYEGEKSHLFKWTKRSVPKWLS